MSICLIGFLICWFKRTQYISRFGMNFKNCSLINFDTYDYIYNQIVYFTRMWNFTWRVSECEENVGLLL